MKVVPLDNNTFSLSTKYEIINYAGVNKSDGAMKFLIEKFAYDTNFYLEFNLKYWPSLQNDPNNQSSGAYLFRVKKGVKESIPYSKVSKLKYVKTNVVSQITIDYDNGEGEKATVRIKMYQKRPFGEWDVKLEGIPLSD